MGGSRRGSLHLCGARSRPFCVRAVCSRCRSRRRRCCCRRRRRSGFGPLLDSMLRRLRQHFCQASTTLHAHCPGVAEGFQRATLHLGRMHAVVVMLQVLPEFRQNEISTGSRNLPRSAFQQTACSALSSCEKEGLFVGGWEGGEGGDSGTPADLPLRSSAATEPCHTGRRSGNGRCRAHIPSCAKKKTQAEV